MAALVPPGSSVIEFGAGRRILEGALPPGCRYTPSDLVDRGGGTIVCDLNAARLPDFDHHDVAVFSGVLEYVFDVSRLVSHLATRVNIVVASYATLDRNRAGRRRHGWVNDFTEAEFMSVFESAGFVCDLREAWKTQTIFYFRRSSLSDGPIREESKHAE